MNNEIRGGRFTSSQIYKLIKSGRSKDAEFSQIGLAYIEEKRIERKLQDSIDTIFYSKITSWGNFMEKRAEKLIKEEDAGYSLVSNRTIIHIDEKLSEFWAGSPDFIHINDRFEVDYISELKCYQKKNFALYTECLLSKNLERFKNDFPAEYWQIVSNCILNHCDYGEAITYMPYISEAEEIKEMAANYDGADQWKYRFICENNIEELAFLKNESEFKNLNRFKFEIPKEDKELLTNKVKLAIDVLQSNFTI